MRKITALSILFSLWAHVLIAQSAIIHYLSGTDKDHTVQWDFLCMKGHKELDPVSTQSRNMDKWTKIPVPSSWEQQGFGSYNYGHDKEKNDEQGLYKLSFSAPVNWKGKKIFIVFEGSMTDTEVKINGKLAGPVHQGGFYRFKYDITSLLKAGTTNLLEVKVSKMSADPSVNRAERNGDFWILSGIFRPVYLEILPQTFIDRVAIDAKADGSFYMDVYASNLKSTHKIEAQIEKLNGEKIATSFSAQGATNVDKIILKTQVDKPALWNPETPNLYQVIVSITDSKGTIHTIKQRFGFRTVELKLRDGFYVNSKKVIFRGVCHHSTWPESGKTMSKEINVMDINLIKEMNMNALRCSHYPPDQDLLDACDSLGLFVLDELTGWQAKYDTIPGKKLVKELVIRDVNHPSIVLWDNGNEGGWNTGLDNQFDLYDPQKRVVFHPWERFNGFDSKHYISYNYLVNSTLYDQDILLPTEFMHGLYDGGHGAGLDDFWSLMMRHPFCAGGFLWAFHDEGVVRTDKDGFIDTDANHAPDGILGPHREKEASFYTIKEIWSPVYIEKRYITPEFSGKLQVENRYIYTNLNQCSFEWKLVTYPSPRSNTTNYDVKATGKPTAPSLAPGEIGWLDLDLPATWNENDALYLTAYDPSKKELFTWSWPIKSPKAIAQQSMIAQATAALPTVTEQNNSLIVINDGIQYYFDKATGYLEKVVTAKNTVSLSGGPVHAGIAHTLKQFNHRKENEKYIVEPVYDGTGLYAIKWIFTAGQPVKLEYRYSQRGDADFMGITFTYPEEKITGMKWMGRGPYRVWKNRMKGMQFGVWHKDYNNTVTGESWKYPEFKGYHAELYWVTVENKESPFTVYAGSENTFLEMLKPEKPKGALNENTSPPSPEGNLGFLHAISAIGTKFSVAEVMGPQSQKNITMNYIPVSGTLWFDFR